MAIDFNALVLAPCFATFKEENQNYPAVVYTPALTANPAFTIGGIFDQAYKEVVFRNGLPTTSVSPVMGCRASDFPHPPLQGDSLVARGITYTVREVRVDGHGGIKLMLNAQQLNTTGSN